jgi:hypothetical protein
MDNPTGDDIARVEARIEALEESIRRCRKLSFAAKAAIAAGAAWLTLTLMAIVPFDTAMLFGALAAVIGGIVLLGSNATTWTQMEESLQASNALRAEMIERMDMRVVDGGIRMIH